VNLDPLIRNWWMMAVRGGLAIAFGLVVLLWPDVTLSVVVVLFGVYALLDGGWTIAVLLEGVVSVGLGALALSAPFVPRQFIDILAGWGIATGVLELVAALYLPREGAGRWLLATAGVSSLFLAFLILLLRHADVERVVHVIAAYALVFGIVLLSTAMRVPGRTAARHASMRG
jgi:uncharacterized membrane protein HdeD (DUF308 family)